MVNEKKNAAKVKTDQTKWFPEKSKEVSCWDKFCAYALITWDGTGFFGLSTSKLGRLKGETVGWLTRF